MGYTGWQSIFSLHKKYCHFNFEHGVGFSPPHRLALFFQIIPHPLKAAQCVSGRLTQFGRKRPLELGHQRGAFMMERAIPPQRFEGARHRTAGQNLNEDGHALRHARHYSPPGLGMWSSGEFGSFLKTIPTTHTISLQGKGLGTHSEHFLKNICLLF